jgi:hypothetical protein
MFGSPLPPIVCKSLIYVICVWWRMVVSTTCFVGYLFCFSSSDVPCVYLYSFPLIISFNLYWFYEIIVWWSIYIWRISLLLLDNLKVFLCGVTYVYDTAAYSFLFSGSFHAIFRGNYCLLWIEKTNTNLCTDCMTFGCI